MPAFLYSTGETLLILFALLLVALLPLFILGLVFFMLRRNRRNRAVWNDLAPRLGLSMPNPKRLRMEGVSEGCAVEVSVGARRTGGEHSRTEFYTYCRADFPHPLRFLLKIGSPKGLLSGVFGRRRIALGQEGFDRDFEVSCYDEGVLRKLLLTDSHSGRTQNLQGDLMLARQTADVIDITDEGVYLERSGQVGDERELRQLIEATTRLVRRFASAREGFPLAEWEQQLLRNWRGVAGGNGFSFDEDRFRMEGVYEGRPVLVALRTDSGEWRTEIKMLFPRSLMAGLRMMPENSFHKALSWLGVQDIETGVREFDDAFIVKGKNVQVVKHRLRPELCRHLTALGRKSSDWLIDDESISFTFDGVIGDARMLRSYLGALRTAARMLAG